MMFTRRFLVHFVLAAAAVACQLDARAGAQTTTQETITVPAVPDKSKNMPVPAAFLKPEPESLEDLRAIQEHVKKVLEKVIPCTVGLRVGGSSGSGVIVSEDGLIMTAAHVSGTPGRDLEVIMPNGKRYPGKTLGGNATIDSGMVRLTEKGKWPFVELGKSSDMKKGDWCIVTGQPGGFRQGRTPVVRYGRIVDINNSASAYLRTDVTFVGGDSGGPTFDLQGRVIGIHSRIGGSITANMDVPVDTYRDTWVRLVKGERWGSGIGDGGRGRRGGRGGQQAPVEPEFGLKLDTNSQGCTIGEVVKDSPAEKAGLKAGDIVKKLDGKETTTAAALMDELNKKRPGDEMTLDILRGTEALSLKVVAGRKPAPPDGPRGRGGF